MRRVLLALVSTVGVVIAFSSSAVAGDVKVKDSGSPDSGTCGNDWANDTFNREFEVEQNGATFVVTEFFKDGHFVTVKGASPGGCEGGSDHGQMVTAGVSGSFHGFDSGPIVGGTFNPNATCPNPCNGAAFTAAFFGKDAKWNVTDFSFSYEAEGGDLLFRRWTNAASGNVGDIATT